MTAHPDDGKTAGGNARDPSTRALIGITLLASLLLVPPVTLAASPVPPYPTVLDDHLGTLDERLQLMEATHGDRPEFGAARQQVSLAANLLVRNATLLSATEIAKGAAALETGRARAVAEGHAERDQALRSEADRLAEDARRTIARVEEALEVAIEEGLAVQGLDRAVLTAYTLLSAGDHLGIHERARTAWVAGERGDRIERSLVGGAAGGAFLAGVASSLWANATEGGGPSLQRTALTEMAHTRAAHADESGTFVAQESRERLDRLVREDEPLMALAAFLLWAQDATFNERRVSTGNAYAPVEELLAEEEPKAEAWLNLLSVPGDLARGALTSATVVLDGDANEQDRAFAASLVVLAVEHTAILGDGYGGMERDLGQPLPQPPTASDDGVRPWAIVAVGAVALTLFLGLGLWWRKRRG